jgi:hypothetical protein
VDGRGETIAGRDTVRLGCDSGCADAARRAGHGSAAAAGTIGRMKHHSAATLAGCSAVEHAGYLESRRPGGPSYTAKELRIIPTTANQTPAGGSPLSNRFVYLGFGAVALVVLLIGGYAGDWAWTGFSDNDTLWDWLQLLLLPIAIASLPIWLGHGKYVHTRVRRILAVGLAAFVVLVVLGYLVPWEWTGFTGNTLWDWIQLVAAPLLLSLVILSLAVGYMRTGIDERRAEADGPPADAPVAPTAAALDHAVATATVSGPKVALAMLEPLQGELEGDHRFHAARGHLLEMAGHEWDAVADYRTAASEAPGRTEERYLLAQASRLTQQLERPL